MKRFVKAYELLFEEHDFYNRVKAIILDNDDKAFGEFDGYTLGGKIVEAFHDFLGGTYSILEAFDFTLEDRVNAVNDFCEEFFSWVAEDDFAELVLQDTYKKGE